MLDDIKKLDANEYSIGYLLQKVVTYKIYQKLELSYKN